MKRFQGKTFHIETLDADIQSFERFMQVLFLPFQHNREVFVCGENLVWNMSRKLIKNWNELFLWLLLNLNAAKQGYDPGGVEHGPRGFIMVQSRDT